MSASQQLFLRLWQCCIFGDSLTGAAFGALIAGGFFAAQYVVSRGTWIGGGDIRLGVLMGLLLGWERTLFALFVAYVGGAFISVLILAAKKGDRKTQLPFGAFLAPATIVALLWGMPVIEWYVGLIT